MKKLLLLTATILPLLITAQQPTKEQIKQVADAKKEVKRMKGEPFPAFELTTLDGETYTKDQLKGKIFLVNFWFTRCGPCIKEMPEMNEMVEEFKNEGIVFLAPTFDDEQQVRKFLEKREFIYESIPDVKDFCVEMNVRSYPTHFVVNREGIIDKVVIGYSVMTVGTLKKSIRKLLKSE
ncbi:TlpA disulfide reductase family protein [Ekhidna sp.]|uniref:TlpA family protein disulfide reductase n=1 Tax=Ekhidna sp. TaxID=2608089 RepID=UPI0032EBA8D3